MTTLPTLVTTTGVKKANVQPLTREGTNASAELALQDSFAKLQEKGLDHEKGPRVEPRVAHPSPGAGPPRSRGAGRKNTETTTSNPMAADL